jgi:glycosyltransferase involved in cell wall biosynthesis
MKILLVHNFYQQPGGEDAVVREELALLQSGGHEVSLFSVHNDEIAGFWTKLKTLLLVTYNPWVRRALARRLSELKPDIVHVHNFFPQLSPSIFDACLDAGVPSVMTLHNFRILCPTGFLYHDGAIREDSLRHSAWWAVRRRVYRDSLLGTASVAAMVETHKRLGTWLKKVDRYIALSPFGRDKFIESGLPPERLVVKANAKDAPPPPMDAPRRGALFVGRLSPEKGVAVLLDAWERLDYPLRIAGDGPLSTAVRNSGNPNVEPIGRKSGAEIRAEMERALFLVLPSVWYEMFPMTLVEAFSARLPLIVSKLGGLADMVEHCVTGLHFEAGNPQDLRDKVEWAIAHPDEMRRMGENARKDYEAKYTPAINQTNLLAIYSDVIAEKRKAAR